MADIDIETKAFEAQSEPADEQVIDDVVEEPVEQIEEERPEAEARPLTETEKFQRARTTYAFRYRQASRLLREAGDQIADRASNMNNCRTNQQLMEAVDEATEGMCSIIDILNRINCGILEYKPKQESGIQVVKG